MSKIFYEAINRTLTEIIESDKKITTVSLEKSLLNKIDRIAKEFSLINNTKNFSRNSIIELALNIFIDEASNVLAKEYSVDINSTFEEEQIEFEVVIFPAREQNYIEMFHNPNGGFWGDVRINNSKLTKIKYLALYRTSPVSAITEFATVKEIIEIEDNKKRIFLNGKPEVLLRPILLGETNPTAMRSTRYTTLEKLLNAQFIDDLFINSKLKKKSI